MMNFKEDVFKKRVKIKVYDLVLDDVQHVDRTAFIVLIRLKGMVNEETFEALTALLYGFSKDIQLRMAHYMIFFATRHELHYTGCPAIDWVLWASYIEIAKEQDILKKTYIQKWVKKR